MGHAQGRGLGILGQLGAIQGGPPGRVHEQQMHAFQQQVEESHFQAQRAALEEEMRRLALVPDMYLADRQAVAVRETVAEPDIEKMPIREFLQARVNAWLEPVTI